MVQLRQRKGHLIMGKNDKLKITRTKTGTNIKLSAAEQKRIIAAMQAQRERERKGK
jgi:hypothetical protein